MFKNECNTFGIASSLPYGKSEYTVNVEGFSCYAGEKHVTMARKPASKGVKIIKLAGYVLALLVIAATVFN